MVHSSFRIAVLALGVLALAGFAVQASGNAPGLDCGISMQSERGLLAIEGILTSPVAMTGEYRISLKSHGNGGSSNINQGGQFAVAGGSAVSLGKVLVNSGAAMDVEFTIVSGGTRFDCSMPLTTSV